MSKLRWLLVGAGDIAHKRVAPALAAAEGSELAAVCDVRTAEANGLAQKYQVERVFSDFEQALHSDCFDAVYLATPVHLHVPQALLALDAGKYILVEKPLCVSVDEGRLLVERAAQTGLTAGCAYFRRLFPAFAYTKDLLARQALGQVLLGNIVYHSWFQPQPQDPKYWRVVRSRSGGGPLSDMGSHMFDVLIGLLDLPVSVYARCANLMTDWDVEDTASLVFNMRGGAQVTASFSWCSKTWKHTFELAGSEARVTWMPFDSGTVMHTAGRQSDTLTLPPAANVHQPLVEDFIRAVADRRSPVCPLSEALKTSILLDAIYRCSADQSEVEIAA